MNASPAGTSGVPGKSADLLIKNGTVVIPGDGTVQADVAIRDGKILSLDSGDERDARETIDATGLHVLPGLIDSHVHLDVFHSKEEELQHETHSALRGGVTTVGSMCWSEEGDSLLETAEEWSRLVPNHGWTDFFPHLVVSEEQHLDQIERVARVFGITSFKLYTAGIEGFFGNVPDGFLLEAARRIRKLGDGARMLVHCENQTINDSEKERIAGEHPNDLSLAQWEETRPGFGEAEAIHRAGEIAREAGVPIYFVHVTSKRGLEAARAVKRKHPQTYVETLCDFLSLEDSSSRGAVLKQVPPLRSRESVDALWEGFQRGKVDVLSTDHVTLTREEKNLHSGNMWEVMPSYQKIEYLLSVLLHYGVHRRNVPLERLVDALTRSPARIFGLYPRKGSLLPGTDADLCLVDLSLEREVDGSESLSIGDFSPWDGETLTGWPVTTIKDGTVVIRDREPVTDQPTGRFLERSPDPS